MPPEEFTNRPDSGRQPYPRRRISTDGTVPPRPNYINRGIPPRPVVAARPMEQPVIKTPPVAEIPAIAPPAPVSVPPPAPLDFTPPVQQPKVRRKRALPMFRKSDFRVSRPVIGVVIAALIIAVGLGLVHWRSGQNNNDVLLRQALELSLSTRSVQIKTSASDQSSSINFDLSDTANTTISTVSSVSLGGAAAQLNGYGDSKNTFISYSQLPKSAAEPFASATKGSWVQLRNAGVSPVGVPAGLARAADPRYQAYGSVLIGNLGAPAKKQLIDYLFVHRVYDYSASKPRKAAVNGQASVRYDITPNVSYLKIANQSLAGGSNLSPTDVQDAVAALDELKGANMQLYVATKSHRIVRQVITKNNKTTTTDYSQFNATSVAAQPQTKLTWATFATNQFRLASQVAAKQSAVSLDAHRKEQLKTLHDAIKNYYIQTASYPSLSNLNDQAWVSANLVGLDPDVLRDPTGTSQALLATPKPTNYAYQVVPAAGKGVCSNTADSPCTHYKLIATLSNNQQYSVVDP